jgi:hypothetical protein
MANGRCNKKSLLRFPSSVEEGRIRPQSSPKALSFSGDGVVKRINFYHLPQIQKDFSVRILNDVFWIWVLLLNEEEKFKTD